MNPSNTPSSNSPLFTRIRAVVAQIPQGKVSTYGSVARRVGTTDARKVGWAVYGNQDKEIPCHRVVNKDGYLAKNFSLGGAKEQRHRLAADGVEVLEDDRVDLSIYLWE